eukprot:1749805-Alexandrium_andersonii.AAC.1
MAGSSRPGKGEGLVAQSGSVGVAAAAHGDSGAHAAAGAAHPRASSSDALTASEMCMTAPQEKQLARKVRARCRALGSSDAMDERLRRTEELAKLLQM